MFKRIPFRGRIARPSTRTARALGAMGLAFATSLAANAHGTTGPERAVNVSTTEPAGAASTTPLPDLAARFRVTLTPRTGRAQQQQWQLTRTATEIGWIKGASAEEVWRRDTSGIRLERVFREDRHLIDYAAGELRTLEVAIDWRELGSLFAEQDLARLKRQGGVARPGGPVHYQGRIGGERVDLQWDPVARLPARLARSGKSGQVLYERIAVHAALPADWPRAGAGAEDFQRLDASDFGDMEYNPVVRKAQARDERAGWRKAHAD